MANSYYDSVVLADSPIRFYSDITGKDIGSQAQNATINGTVKNALPGLLLTEEQSPSWGLTGTAGSYISAPTAGLPTGAANWAIEGWLNGQPNGAFQGICSLGTEGAGTVATFYIRSTSHNNWELWDGSSASDASDNSAIYGVPTYIVFQYDGTKLYLYLNGSATATLTKTTTLNLAYGVFRLGSDPAALLFNGVMAKFAMYSSILSTTQMSNHYNAGLARLVTHARVGGSDGIYVGQFNQGSIGG